MARILLVEDDPRIASFISRGLAAEGHVVDVATAGLEGMAMARAADYPLVILDRMLPDMDGVDVSVAVRQSSGVPILVLSARGAEGDKVRALDAGTDDYVTKPFGAEELLARIRAALRRVESPSPASEPIVRGGLVIDRARFRVLRDGEEVRLTPKEFELLTYLAQHPGRVLTHRTILKAIWGPHAADQPEHLRVLVGALRKKIEPNPAAPQYILTEPWVGYRFADL